MGRDASGVVRGVAVRAGSVHETLFRHKSLAHARAAFRPCRFRAQETSVLVLSRVTSAAFRACRFRPAYRPFGRPKAHATPSPSVLRTGT